MLEPCVASYCSFEITPSAPPSAVPARYHVVRKGQYVENPRSSKAPPPLLFPTTTASEVYSFEITEFVTAGEEERPISPYGESAGSCPVCQYRFVSPEYPRNTHPAEGWLDAILPYGPSSLIRTLRYHTGLASSWKPMYPSSGRFLRADLLRSRSWICSPLSTTVNWLPLQVIV